MAETDDVLGDLSGRFHQHAVDELGYFTSLCFLYMWAARLWAGIGAVLWCAVDDYAVSIG